MKTKRLWSILIILCIIFTTLTSTAGAYESSDNIVTLNLSNGSIDITPTGYTQGNGNEVPFTGAYVITGSRTADTPLDFFNNSGSPVIFNVTLSDAQIIGAAWCTAVRMEGNNEIILNLTNKGNTKIETISNHPALRVNKVPNVTINITNPAGATLYLGRGDQRAPYVYCADGEANVTINGESVDNSKSYYGHTHLLQPSWTPEITEMTLEEYLNNEKGVICKLNCPCNQTTEVSDFSKSSVNPDCMTNGWGQYTATVDNNTYSSKKYTLTALGHDYKDTVTAPTCTEKGYTTHTCSRCDDSYTDSETVATSHQLAEIAEKVATCTEDGQEAYWICENCERLFSDAEGKTQIEKPIAIVAKGHSYKDGKCTVCGEKLIKPVPGTGDKSNLIFWFGILLVSGAGITAIIIYGRKKKYSK